LRELVEQHGATLLAVAEKAIRVDRRDGRPWLPDPAEFPAGVRELHSSFVTLKRGPRLLGCIGGLEAVEPLVVDVARHARSAATEDPRFDPVSAEDFERMDLEVSVLSAMEPLPVRSPDELRAALRPAVDGVLVGWRGRRGTFLPDVWHQLPDVDDFLRALWHKAGLPAGFWAEDIALWRYGTAAATAPGPRPPLHAP
jgi:AmmeMemoRadiSam system protein A